MPDTDFFPEGTEPFADVDAFNQALRRVEDRRKRVLLGYFQKVADNDPNVRVQKYEYDNPPDLNGPASELVTKEIPKEAQTSPEAFRAFIAPLMSDATLVEKAVMFIGGKDTEVVTLRPMREVRMATGGVLRGDGTWPWVAEIDGNDIVVRNAKVTAFGGDHDTQDSGATASGVFTRGNPGLIGCSIPMRYNGMNRAVLRALGGSPIPRLPFGLKRDGSNNPDGAHVEIALPDGGKLKVPVIDVGPAKHTGNALDLTVAVAKKFQANATANNFKTQLTYRILNGARLAGLQPVAVVSLVDGFANRLATGARGEFEAFSQFHETTSPLRGRILQYWADLKTATNDGQFNVAKVSVAWSAAFVSWNVLRAGATREEFRFAAAHSGFVHHAINNPNGAFKAHPVGEYAPQVGDIIQNNRDDQSFDFGHARNNAQYTSHSAIVVEVGIASSGKKFAVTIGGNESDSIRRRTIPLDADGKIIQPQENFYIAVIQVLKA